MSIDKNGKEVYIQLREFIYQLMNISLVYKAIPIKKYLHMVSCNSRQKGFVKCQGIPVYEVYIYGSNNFIGYLCASCANYRLKNYQVKEE